MTAAVPSSRGFKPTAELGWARSCLPLGILLLEYLALSLTFDIRPLSGREDVGALGSLGALGPLILCVATATALIGGRKLWRELLRALDLPSPRSRGSRRAFGTLAFVHGIAFTSFYALTGVLTRADPVTAVQLIAVAWVGSGVLTFATAVHAALPLPSLLRLARRTWRLLSTGAGVGVVAWGVGVWAERLWLPLADATLFLAGGLLRLLGAEVSTDPATATLALEGFEVVVAPICSGYQGVGLILILTGAYLWGFRRELYFPISFVLVPVAVALVFLANSVRIAALMALGAWGSPDLAIGGFHSKAGWILFCAISLGLVAFTQRSPLLHRRAGEERARGAAISNPTAGYLMPMLSVVAAGMVTSLFSSGGFDLLYPLGVGVGALTLWLYWRDRLRLGSLSGSGTACILGVAAFAIWVALEPSPDAAAVAAFDQRLGALPAAGMALWVVCRVVGSVVVVPAVEELAFRGYLLRRLVSADFTRVPFGCFTWFSFLVSSLAFGLLHQRWLAGCLVGLLFALAQVRRGRLSDAILAHAVANLLVAGYALGWQRWSLWM